MEQGLVSVIVPTYNRAAYVTQALASVACQTYEPVEIVLVDDGSTDETAQIVDAWNLILAPLTRTTLTCVRQANQGVSAARNAGLRIARGEFVSFLDSDDLLYPGKLSLQVEHLDARPDECVVGCFSDVIFEDGEPTRKHGRRYYDPDDKLAFLLSKWISLNGVATYLFRRTSLARIGSFNEDLRREEDWVFLVCFLVQGNEMAMVRKPLCVKREHSRSAKRGYYNPDRDRYAIKACQELFAHVSESAYCASHLPYLAYPVWRWARAAEKAGRTGAVQSYFQLLGRIHEDVGLPDGLRSLFANDGASQEEEPECILRSLRRVRNTTLRSARFTFV